MGKMTGWGPRHSLVKSTNQRASWHNLTNQRAASRREMGSSGGHQEPPLICLCHKNIKQNTWLTCQKLMAIAVARVRRYFDWLWLPCVLVLLKNILSFYVSLKKNHLKFTTSRSWVSSSHSGLQSRFIVPGLSLSEYVTEPVIRFIWPSVLPTLKWTPKIGVKLLNAWEQEM